MISKWVLKQIKPEILLEAKDDKIEVVLFWAHYEKARFFPKDNNAGKDRKQQKKRSTQYEME